MTRDTDLTSTIMHRILRNKQVRSEAELKPNSAGMKIQINDCVRKIWYLSGKADYVASLTGKRRLFLIQPKKYRVEDTWITFCFFIWVNHKIKQSNLFLWIVTQPATKNHFLEWCFNYSNIYSIWHLFGDTIKRNTSVCNKTYRVINIRAIALSMTFALAKLYTLYGCGHH